MMPLRVRRRVRADTSQAGQTIPNCRPYLSVSLRPSLSVSLRPSLSVSRRGRVRADTSQAGPDSARNLQAAKLHVHTPPSPSLHTLRLPPETCRPLSCASIPLRLPPSIPLRLRPESGRPLSCTSSHPNAGLKPVLSLSSPLLSSPSPLPLLSRPVTLKPTQGAHPGALKRQKPMDRQSQEPTRDHTPACQSALSVKNRCIAKDQIWSRAAMAGLGKGQMGEGGLREGGLVRER
jgi:hypothetical protein